MNNNELYAVIGAFGGLLCIIALGILVRFVCKKRGHCSPADDGTPEISESRHMTDLDIEDGTSSELHYERHGTEDSSYMIGDDETVVEESLPLYQERSDDATLPAYHEHASPPAHRERANSHHERHILEENNYYHYFT